MVYWMMQPAAQNMVSNVWLLVDEEVMSEAEVTFLKVVSWNLPWRNENYEKPNLEYSKSNGFKPITSWTQILILNAQR